MQGRAAGLASVLVLLTAFSVSRLQAQNEEIPVEQLLAEFKAITAQVGRLSVKVAALDARINALEKTAVPDPLAGIPLAEENRCTPYDADDYAYPLSVETEIVAGLGGRIYSPYSGETFASAAETDIEHIVARSEAHDSGLCAADAATRSAFARDLLNLTLADPDLNRSRKRDKDLADWLPERNRCWFGGGEAEVWADDVAARNVLVSCVSVEMVEPTPIPTRTPTPAPQADDPLELYDDNGNGRISCAEATASRRWSGGMMSAGF